MNDKYIEDGIKFIKNKMDLKQYIESHDALKRSVLCEKINWATSSFCEWMKGNRSIPEPKRKALEKVLEDYGYVTNKLEK